jgi:hypothetical protein
MTSVWDDKRIGRRDKLVALALADHADDDGRCFPSIDRIAEKALISRRSAIYAIARLEELGVLSVEHNAGPKGTNVYVLSVVQNLHSAKSARVQNADPKLHPNRQEPSVRESSSRAREDDGFDEVWDLYDKKESKLYARRAWGRLSKKDRAAALARIPDYVRATPDRKYRANLSTWLNGRKWEDEDLPATTTQANHVPRTTPLSARQYAGLSYAEKLARGGFRPEDFQ